MDKITATLFLLACSTFLLSSADPVLDSDGNAVTAGADYYIEINGITTFPELGLESHNGSSCARYAAYGYQPAVPVRFRPYRGSTLQLGSFERFLVKFTSAPSCAGGRWWTGDSSYVVAGAGTTYFAVLLDQGKYTLGECGPCFACKTFCVPVGLDGHGLLKYGFGMKPLKVLFRKAAA